MADSAPLISVSLVTFNGENWIVGCLQSLLAQRCDRIELILVDNSSSDGTVERARLLLSDRKNARIIRLKKNVGYGAAHNLAISQSQGEFVCLLNQDVFLDPGFLEQAVQVLMEDPLRAAAQGHLLGLSAVGERLDTVDSTGLEILRDRRIRSRDQGRRDADGLRPAGPVFGADGPAPVYRRAALQTVAYQRGSALEFVDEQFFLYHEDTDLAWRLQRSGWVTWYVPTARAWHARGSAGPTSTSMRHLLSYRRRLPKQAAVLAWRNHRLMIISNEELNDLVRDLVPIMRREVGSLVLLAFVPSQLIAMPSLVRHMPLALRKRRAYRRAFQGRRPVRSIKEWTAIQRQEPRGARG